MLLLAGLFTPLCAFAGGFVGALVAGQSRWLAAATLCGLIAAESTYLYITQRVDGPLWFEAGAAGALIVAPGIDIHQLDCVTELFVALPHTLDLDDPYVLLCLHDLPCKDVLGMVDTCFGRNWSA